MTKGNSKQIHSHSGRFKYSSPCPFSSEATSKWPSERMFPCGCTDFCFIFRWSEAVVAYAWSFSAMHSRFTYNQLCIEFTILREEFTVKLIKFISKSLTCMGFMQGSIYVSTEFIICQHVLYIIFIFGSCI